MQKLIKLAEEQNGRPYTSRNGLIYYKHRVVLPFQSYLIPQLLHIQKIDAAIPPSMKKVVQEYVSACETCQRVKTETLVPAGLLQPLTISCPVWEDITMDFIKGLPPHQWQEHHFGSSRPSQ